MELMARLYPGGAQVRPNVDPAKRLRFATLRSFRPLIFMQSRMLLFFLISLTTPLTGSGATNAIVDDATIWEGRPWPSEFRGGAKIDRIVVHSTVAIISATDKSPTPYAEWFSKKRIFGIWRQYGVAPHYFIGRDGSISRLVPESEKAFHARGYNEQSIGIELAGIPEEKWILDVVKGKATASDYSYTRAQYRSLSLLIEDIRTRHPETKAILHMDIWDLLATVRGAEGPVMLKAGPGAEFKELRLVKSGTKVWILEKRNGWAKVEPAFNESGWISSESLSEPTYSPRKRDPGSHFNRTNLTCHIEWVIHHNGSDTLEGVSPHNRQ